MYTALVILAILVAVLLILIVLIQNPKGGGLSSAFGGSSQMLGVQKTNDFLEKATWALAISLLVISLSINFFIPRGESATESIIQEQIDKTPVPMQNQTLPAAPSVTPSDSAKK
ncbi:preprotein translocase subunit SecG [Solitalea koreensis]|uniref:Protein-export membrane protein SecG n=1 Tax=Solitalea koreensis TaxID=543615 RepID=A0A521AZ88_9SPHI|nr:preprotein translocase subunit SecG [Solitalea koreensis]SMO40126.1 preprotein translocase subunit SecG [Solitalea koreensis]